MSKWEFLVFPLFLSANSFAQGIDASGVRSVTTESVTTQVETTANPTDTAPPAPTLAAPDAMAYEAYCRNNPAACAPATSQLATPMPNSTADVAAQLAREQQLAGFMQSCISTLGALLGGSNNQNNIDSAELIMDEADEINEQRGWRPAEGISPELATEVGTATEEAFPLMEGVDPNATGCNRFISRDGKLGPWGAVALEEIRKFPDSFANNVPRDVASMCPNYTGFSKERREMFWVWAMMSISYSESSVEGQMCNPRAANRKCNRSDAARTGCRYNANSPPNGDALGLFQLEPRRCGGANEEQLFKPGVSTRCAARVLAGEMVKRDTLSTNQRDTYWGPLRCNTRHSGDARAATKTVNHMMKFPGCGAGGRPLCD